MRSRSSSTKPRGQRTLRLEQLEARLPFAVDGFAADFMAPLDNDVLPIVSAATVQNQPPEIARPISGVIEVTTDRTLLSVLGRDDAGERKLKYRWQVDNAPAGANVLFSANNSNSAKKTTLKFSQAGVYRVSVAIVDASGLQTRATYSINVVQTLKQIKLFDQSQKAVANNAKLSVTGATTTLSLVASDQFNRAMPVPRTVQWSTSASAGATAQLRNSGNSVVLTFNRAADYKFKVSEGSLSTSFSVKVVPSLTRIQLTPGVTTVNAGSQQQFTATGLDQFGNPLVRQPSFKWTASSGTISSRGLWSVPPQTTTAEVRVASGTLSIASTLGVAIPKSDFQTPAIDALVKTYFADGSITRPEMIQILRSAGIDGRVDTTELSDLRFLVNNSGKYNIPDHVRLLANDVVNGNPANAMYQGLAAGNLVAGNTGPLLNMLVDKWFLGTDRPTLTSGNLSYQVAAGSLFGNGPSYLQQRQGQLGDCYLVSSLGIIAAKRPDAIKEMFIDNKDGTFTVRFFTGVYGAFSGGDGSISDGFRTGVGTADYVTVDRWLPARTDGRFAYSNSDSSMNSSSNALWIALAEKAYAQWNATGKSGRSIAANTYRSIEGGWMSTFSAQVLGYNANNYLLLSTPQQKLIDALNSGKAVTVGTKSSGQAGSLVPDHAYSITGFNSQTNQFQLFNPWGTNHPAGLTYGQLQQHGTYFVVADPARVTASVSSFQVPAVRNEIADHLDAVPIVVFTSWQIDSTHLEQGIHNLDHPHSTPGLDMLFDTHQSAQDSPERIVSWSVEEEDAAESAERALDSIDLLFGLLAEDDRLFS